MEKKVYIGFEQQGAGPTMPEFLFFLTTKSCEIEELKLRWTRFSILATGNAKLRAGGGEGCAFDLMLNLGVHAHLLEPMQSEEQQACGEEAASSVHSTPLNGSSLSSPLEIETYGSGVHKENGSLKTSLEKPERRTPLAVGQFEAWLLDILCEMLLFLVQVQTSSIPWK
jgi:hypothetical protein